MSQETDGKHAKLGWILVLCVGLVILCAAAGVIWFGLHDPASQEPTQSPTQSTPQTTTTPTQATTAAPTKPTTIPTEPPVEKIASATIASMGDILMHGPVRDTYITQYIPGTNVGASFHYGPIFSNIQETISQADYAVINLETPLAGLDNGYTYSGNAKHFNAPDDILDYAKAAGFDMMLTANNHTYDCGSVGMHRTIDAILKRQLAYLGTQQTSDEPDYTVVDINGIHIGMACYTYEIPYANNVASKSLNGHWVDDADLDLVSSFDSNWLDLFYSQVAADIAGMRDSGAEAVVLYLHWGNEYQLVQSTDQQNMAQKLCDMGVDVIVGGHPHVVQPLELLTSTADPNHKTVCLYSMGNAVSSQRRHKMNLDTGHTEDGMIFNITFSKYSDGTVILEKTDVLPVWVNDQYQILPIKDLADPELAGVAGKLQESYNRTMAIVGGGLETVKSYLQSNTATVEAQFGIKN